MKKKITLFLIIFIYSITLLILVLKIQKERDNTMLVSNNEYNMAFYQLVDYIDNVKNFLAKSLISSSSEESAKTLAHVWRESNLAQIYLSMLPIQNQELENTQTFLNQVSEYSYALSMNSIKDRTLSDSDLSNLQQLYSYCENLQITLNQLSNDLSSGNISWSDLNSDSKLPFAQQVANVSQDSFSNLEENFHEYAGLIYDGAFSDHIVAVDKKGLTGDDVSEDVAKDIAIRKIPNKEIKDINSLGFSDSSDIPAYTFHITTQDDTEYYVTISKKGGHLVYLNTDKAISYEGITPEDAIQSGKNYLDSHEFPDMKETYYLTDQNIMTINYAYYQDNVVIYSDLIKVKVALDTGEILGIETSGYLNCHAQRSINKKNLISVEKASTYLNKNLNIYSSTLAIIPTEWKTEILCYEFKGKINNIDFLVYVNAETGKEEDILVVTNTPNGTMTT